MILMPWTNEANKEEKKLSEKSDLGDHYFGYSNTAEYFPVMKYTPDYVPFGSADRYCIHLEWNKVEHKRMYDMYKQVQKFPTCANSQNPKYRW